MGLSVQSQGISDHSLNRLHPLTGIDNCDWGLLRLRVDVGHGSSYKHGVTSLRLAHMRSHAPWKLSKTVSEMWLCGSSRAIPEERK